MVGQEQIANPAQERISMAANNHRQTPLVRGITSLGGTPPPPPRNPHANCVGCAIVHSDNAPDCGVAQGVIHGVVGHHGKKEEEVEGEVEKEVDGGQGRRQQSNTSAHVHG